MVSPQFPPAENSAVANAMDEARAFLRRYRSFAITSHLSPDGDATGSQAGLACYLAACGRDALIVNDEPVPPDFRFLPGSGLVVSPAGYPAACRAMKHPPEAAVFLECCTPQRAGRSGEILRRLPVLNIDHHKDNTAYGKVNLVMPGAAACGEILYHLVGEQGKLAGGAETAVSFYTAILTDTSFFRFNCRPETLRAAASLVEAGADPEFIAASVYEKVSHRALRLLGLSLSTIRQSPDGRITWCRVERAMYRETGTREVDSEGFIDYLRVVGESRVTFVLKELSRGRTRVNLRSRGDFDVQAVAAAFGGGGHRNAAGCTLETDIGRAEKLVLRELQAVFNGPGPG